MTDGSLQSCELQHWLERMRGGDRAALDELLRQACGRLERLARHMLHAHPAVHRWAQTGDVLQGALLRLTRALEKVRPESVREFIALAAQQIRRELIDLARHFHGPEGAGAHHASGTHPPERPDENQDPDALDEWGALHEQVERLPDEERQVVDLLFYQGLSQADAAVVLGISVRTL